MPTRTGTRPPVRSQVRSMSLPRTRLPPGTFACGAENEQAVDATGQDVLDEPFEAGDIEPILAQERGGQRRNNAPEGVGEYGALHAVT